jgi:hypothetical protein
MTKSNYALLTALYDSQTSDFYRDIYFPAVKYGLFLLYNSQTDIQKYYTVENVQGKVEEVFGVKIPLVVIKQAIKIIRNGHSDFSIELLSNGDQFAIRRAWDKTIADSIEYVYERNVTSFANIETLFSQYLTIQHVQTDKTFLSFFSENTEEIYHYINNDNDDSVLINEEYIHVVNFLKWIKKENIEIYNVAADIFWGSVIAAFLKREIDLNIKPETQVSYYLDSSLILSLLDLDSQANNQYTSELVSLIKSSGNLPYVHPLTIREVNSILFSVERDRLPKPGSGIADAYYRRGLTPTKIMQIRQTLRALIAKEGLHIENASEAQLDTIQKEYKNKPSVVHLSTTRQTPLLDNIRDIHDVFMMDFITKKQAKCVSIEKCNTFFVSLNNDLIELYKSKSPNTASPIIHPSRIVLDLWIHDSKTTVIKKEALAEAIARSTALNQTDVRRKLRQISKCYKSEEFTEDKYKAVFLALMDRSKQVMGNVDAMVASADTDVENAQRLAEQIVQMSITLEAERREANIDLQRRLDELKEIVLKGEEEKKANSDAKDTYTGWIEEKSKNQGRLLEIDPKLANYEKERDKSTSMWRYWLSMILQIFCLIVILIFGIKYLATGIHEVATFSEFANENKELIISIAFTVLVAIASGLMKLSIFTPCKAYRKEKQTHLQDWDNEHKDYRLLLEERESLINKIAEIQKVIDTHHKK